jgi:Tfp pilus assembly protein FimT
MSLLALLVLFSITSSFQLFQKNDQQTLIDHISTAIQYTRIQALNKTSPIYLEALDSNWAKGMVLLQNTKNPKLLYQWQWHHPLWLISWSGIHADKIIFSSNPLTAMSNGTFDLYNIKTKQHIYLVINRLGRINREPATI